MTIASEIQRVQTNIENAYTSLEAKGATMPDARNSANLAATIESVSGGGGEAKKYGVPIDMLLWGVDSTGKLVAPTDSFEFDGTGIKIIPSTAASMFNSKFKSSNITKFKLPDLTTIQSGSQHFQSVCASCSNLTEVILPAMEMKTNSFRDAFSGCTGLTSVVVPFTKITGSNGCYSMFSSCTNLATVTFPNLTEINSGYACYNMFSGCSKLKEITFPALTSILLASAVQGMFTSCTGLTKVYFPALTNTTDLGNSSGWMFASCTSLTEIHFRADMQSTIEALPGYANKWGATNATIYFSL